MKIYVVKNVVNTKVEVFSTNEKAEQYIDKQFDSINYSIWLKDVDSVCNCTWVVRYDLLVDLNEVCNNFCVSKEKVFADINIQPEAQRYFGMYTPGTLGYVVSSYVSEEHVRKIVEMKIRLHKEKQKLAKGEVD